jgi:hypothetical protein
MVAREVLTADAANLLPNNLAPAREGDQMPLYVAKNVRPGEATA